MVERAALEMRYTRKRIGGSNPSLSAKRNKTVCPSLLEQAVLFLFCKDAVSRLRDYAEIPHFPQKNIRNIFEDVPNSFLSLLKCTIRIENHNLLDRASIG